MWERIWYAHHHMCGIGGIMRTDGEPIPEDWLDAIDARIAYRGPDGHGRFRDRVEIEVDGKPRTIEVALIHRRLSIIDHADGAQPMVSERGRTDEEGLVAVVFNGCIYNHRELREELEAAGHTFVTDHSDTEVLIHGWRQWGEELTQHLEGMYAFAIWDRTVASLYLARDVFGEKPLYYRATLTQVTDLEVGPPVIAFSSEATSLWALPAPDPVAGDHCRYAWLIPQLQMGYSCHGTIPGPDLVDVETLSPATGDLSNANKVHPGCGFTHVDLKERAATGLSIDQLLERAVARRLEADVPLGCFLSGGVDSSLVAHFGKKHKPDLRTFSVKMPDVRYDESKHAETVSRYLGTDHTTLTCETTPAEDLVHLIGVLGIPFGDSSILPTYWVSKVASEHVTVALSGDGGDELFIGYERYLAARPLARYHRLLRWSPRWLMRFHPKSRLHKLGRLGDMARDFGANGVAVMEALFTLEELEKLDPIISGRRWKCSLDTEHATDDGLAMFGGHTRSGSDADALEDLRDFDLECYLPDDLLRKVDTASMACALEVRCPFLDRDLASAVLSMPIDQLIPGGKRKGLLRNIARKYLPKEVVDRPKMGFAIPIGEWFRSDYGGMKTLLLDHLNSTEPFGPISLNPKAVQRFIDEHMRGTYDHGQKLFTLLTLSIWARSL